jgi:hypothetical protein
VRSYVIPANPKSTAQTTQRGYLTEAVAKIHATLALATHKLDADDQAAYSLLASCFATPRTWFNQICKLWLNCRKAAKIPIVYSDGTISSTAHATFSCIMYLNEKTASSLAAGKFYFGTSKTALINSTAATVVAGVSVALTAVDLTAFLTAAVKYYMQFKPDVADPCYGALSGIYTFTAT